MKVRLDHHPNYENKINVPNHQPDIYIYIYISSLKILVLHQGIALANIPKNMCVCIPFSNWWFQPTPFKIMEFLRQEVGARNVHRLGGHGIPKDFADEGWPVGAHQGGIGIAPLGHVNSLARFPEAFWQAGETVPRKCAVDWREKVVSCSEDPKKSSARGSGVYVFPEASVV